MNHPFKKKQQDLDQQSLYTPPILASFSAWAIVEKHQGLEKQEVEQKRLKPFQVRIQIEFCGVCRSDWHCQDPRWYHGRYPLIPGHAGVGQVIAIGEMVNKWTIGDYVGIGPNYWSCQNCSYCQNDQPFWCSHYLSTYGSFDRSTQEYTQGCYAEQIVVQEDFLITLPKKMPRHQVPPFLCSGLTMYQVAKKQKFQAGQSVAIVGLGALGHMGVLIYSAMGMDVSVISSQKDKLSDALKMGAKNSFDQKKVLEQTRQANLKFDFIVNTICIEHNLNYYMNLLSIEGVMILLGIPAVKHPPISLYPLIEYGQSITGSHIGGIKQTEELLEWAQDKQIQPWTEIYDFEQVNACWEKLEKNEIRYLGLIQKKSKNNS